MSPLDPYTDVARWLDMDARAESKLRHPAGKGISESSEVRQARQDDEAIRLANSGRPRRVPDWLCVVALIVFGWLLLGGVSAAAALVEGWPW